MNKLQKIKYFILGAIVFIAGGTVYAVNLQPSFTPSLIPVEDAKYYLGSTSPARVWAGINVYEICLSGDCKTAWPTGGGGSGGGSWSTTTSSHTGRLINYPNNTTDIVVIGGTATTTGATEVWFDPNTQNFKIGSASTASTTIMGDVRLPNILQGYSYIGSNGLLQTVSTSTLSAQVFPFTSVAGYNSTSTVLALLGGFFSTASSTFSGNFYLPALSQGFAYIGSNGKVNSVASSSVNLSGFNNDLATLTATDGTLTFSGSYNGATARTVGINLSNSNTWGGTQAFTNTANFNTWTNNGSATTTNLAITALTGILVGNGSTKPISVAVSGTDLKTINGVSIIGSGDITVTGSGSGLASSTPWTLGSLVVAKDNGSVTTISTSTIKGSEITNDLGWTSGGGGGSGTISTSTPLVSGQVAFSTGVSTIGNDSNFTFDSVSDKLTVSLASTTGLSADFGFFNYINATSTTATSTFAGAVQVGSTAGDHLLKMTASRSHGTGASTGGMVNLNNTLNNSSALTIYSNAGAGQSTLGLQFIKQDNALADTYLQRLDNDGVGRTILINAINPLSTASVFDIQNTSSGVGININQASTTTTLSPITITNAGMTPGIQITQTNASNSQGAIRIDSATPEIEMVETDQVSPAGKFEMRVNNNVWGVNSRVLADNSFEEVMSLSQLSQGGALTLLYPGVGGYPTKNSRFGIIGINTATTTNYLSISTDGSSGSGQGTPLDDIFVIKGSNGNVGIASSSPGSIFSIGTTNGINFTTATTSFSTTGGINISSGCFSIAGTCISGGGGGGVTSVSGTYPIISSGGTTPAISIAFSTTTANIWSALNTFNGGLTIGTTTAGILRTNASGVVYASSASTTISLFNGFTNPDSTCSTTACSSIQPAQVNAPAGTYGGMVYIASSTSAKTGFYGTIDIPDNFASSSAQVKVNWTATSTASGNVVFDFDYRCVGGDNTTSLYSATFQESTTTTVANPTTGGFRKNTTLNINAGYYCSAGDTMEFFLARDGADGADTGNVDTEIYNAVIKFLTQ